MGNISETQYFQAVQDKKMEVSDVLEQVYIALTEKGYNLSIRLWDISCLGTRLILPAIRAPEVLS